MIKNVSEALEVTDCRVVGIPGYFWCRDRCNMPGRLGGRRVLRRGGREEWKARKREVGARAAHRWPVASLHNLLPGPGSSSSMSGKAAWSSQHGCKRPIANRFVRGSKQHQSLYQYQNWSDIKYCRESGVLSTSTPLSPHGTTSDKLHMTASTI